MIGYEYVTSQIWAIKQENLKTILEIAARVNPSVAEIEASTGKKLANSNESTVQDGVQVIDVIGPIVRYGNMFSEVSGARSLSNLKAEFTEALMNEDVKSILLNIDSPGGEANGINEFAEFVYNSRGIKPITSYVSNMACSAAYWIASATDKIVCDETASLGSIGCVAVIRDTEEKDAKEGIKNIKFVSSNSPNKRPDFNTPDGKAVIQEQIDALGDIFISKVARNRSTETNALSFQDVVKKYNKGGVLMGKDAVSVGLADELGSFESILTNLQSGGSTTLQDNKESSLKVEGNIMDNTKKDEKVEKVATEDEKVVEASTSKKTEDTPKLDANLLAEYQAKNVALENKLANMEASFEAIKAHSEAVEQKALKVEAEAIVASFSGKFVPAQVDANVKAYILASNDDKTNPVEGYSRVEALKASWESLPDHG